MPDTILSSDVLQVFPCVSRKTENAMESSLLSETNLTSIIKNITDMPSYVISFNSDVNNNYVWEFVLGGYYFKINYTIPPNNYLYVILKTYQATTDNYSEMLQGDTSEGSDSNFDGLEFIATDNSEYVPNATHYLCLYANGGVPKSSLMKMSSKSLNIGIIDCGNLT